MLVFLCFIALLFLLFLNEFCLICRFHISPTFSILSFLLCLGLSMVEGVILENLFFPLSKVSFFNPDAQRIEKYWRCVSICHMGCSQSNFHQTDVIYQPLSEDATLKQQARKEPERERKTKQGTKE